MSRPATHEIAGRLAKQAQCHQTAARGTARTQLDLVTQGRCPEQKVVIARWLLDKPKVLILDEPSRGVDVGARAEVHRVIRELASTGTAILVISSDNEELVTLCDRVVVLAEGHVSGQLIGEEITEDRLVSLSFARSHGKESAA